jgi:hypothetical protein
MREYKERKKVHPVPVPVQGRIDKPFVLMSWPSEMPNLNAVDVLDAYNVTWLYCFHFNETLGEDYSDNLQDSSVRMHSTSNAESSLKNLEFQFNSYNENF